MNFTKNLRKKIARHINGKILHWPMSFVTLIVIKEKQLQTISAHFRVIKNIIEHHDLDFEILKTADKTQIDEGYILIDCDNKIIINSQNAFQAIAPDNFKMIIV